MKTKIKTLHEEYYNNIDKSISILINYNKDGFIENDILFSYILYYHNSVYIVFNTISDCIDFVIYGTENIQRGYIEEEYFDEIYEEGIDGYFKDEIEWVNITEEDKI